MSGDAKVDEKGRVVVEIWAKSVPKTASPLIYIESN